MKLEIVESKEFELIAPLVEEVQNLHAALYPHIYKPFHLEEISEIMKKMLADKHYRLFVAQANGATIGYLMLVIKEFPENAFHYSYKFLHIEQIAVSKTNQGAGVGSMLINKAEAIARDLAVSRLELDHLDNNAEAATFFKKKGFVPYRSKLSKILA